MHNLRNTKIFLTLLSISILLFLLLSSKNSLRNSPKPTQISQIQTHKHIQIAKSACQGTLYPNLCISTLSSFPDLPTKSLPEIISATLNKTLIQLRISSSNCFAIRKNLKKLDPLQKRALNDCLELFDATIAELRTAMSKLFPRKSSSRNFHDLQTLLSAAMTNQYTCLDGFAFSDGKMRGKIENRLYKISRHVSNSMVMLKKIPGGNMSESEVLPEYGRLESGFPTWVSAKDRKLLQSSGNETKYDVVVAKDGTGKFTTIGEAVAAAPTSSNTRFVIYIKGGTYLENVEVERKKSMLMFVGDGIGKTVVKASRNVVDGWTTYGSATVAVVGSRFIAQGITFENSAGPNKLQAVAFRSGSDFSAFYQCSFVGYQDTLFVYSLRQFYRECDIYGTIDFIFGNAAVVFQNCNLYARKPNQNQQNIFTAQGRDDPNQNTGISILNCKITAASDLDPVKTKFKTYLGRPWKEYSRTVFLRSYIDDLVDPAGWVEWNGTFALTTLYYGEYMNTGAGSNTSRRVKWPGYRVINSSIEAILYTAGAFIQGNEWLNSTNIPFYLNLS